VIPFLHGQSPTTRRNGIGELLDGDSLGPDALAANLREIRLINRGLGWTAITVQLIEDLARGEGLQSWSYLDVATGSGDLPRAVLHRAIGRSWAIEAHGLDASDAVLGVARQYLGEAPVALHLGDARVLPFADRSIDVVSCALALHHFAPDDATLVLRELARVARRAWLLVDLERSFPAYLGALALRLLMRSPVTRQDAPASVLRAYTLPELRALLDSAGLGNAYAGTRFPFRLVAWGTPTAP